MDRRHLEDAGFTPEQIDALIENFSPTDHSHEMSDVMGLEEELAAIEDDDDGDDDDN
jgi:hypothetical protein